ncbi:MAG: hypothetical protein FJW30_04715 [Acidobacteria bacterium]|nr:hypothetical protein [Acidobacteriota bacterium]
MPASLSERLGFNARERAIFQKLTSPEKIQRFLDEQISYDPGENCRSNRRVLRERRGHCVEGALLASTALRLNGEPPLLLDMEASKDDDHVVALFQRYGLWGAIGKSNYAGLRYREPVYRTVRELVMSYFEHYFNKRGERSLRGYSRPVNILRFDGTQWHVDEEDVWHIPVHLAEVAHTPLLPRKVAQRLTRLDRRLRAANEFGMRQAG